MSTVWHEIQEEPGRAAPHAPTREAGLWPPESVSSEVGTGSGLDLSFFGGLAVSLGSLADSFRRDQDRKDWLAGSAPQDFNPTMSVTVPSGGFAALDLGSVPEGRVWQVRRLSVGGPTATSTPTGAAFAIAQGAAPIKTAISTANVVDTFPTFTKGAGIGKYGTHQLFLVAPEHLWVVVHGATATSQWVASARIEDFPADLYYQATQGVIE